MKFKKKPVVIDAIQLNGCTTGVIAAKRWMETGQEPSVNAVHTCDIKTLEIPTLEGVMTAQGGDWIIKGVQGEFYPCKPDIFQETYDPVK